VEPLLYLVHRIPFPPNKGDKVRSHNILKHLSERFEVHLGSFVDAPEDERYVAELPRWCASHHVLRLNPRAARLKSAMGLLRHRALSIDYYADARMRQWVDGIIAQRGIRKALVYSSQMAQYVLPHTQLRRVVDFVDVDSAKWARYVADHRWPMSWVYRREAGHLLRFERAVAQGTDASVLVTEAEAALFTSLAPESAAKVHSMKNGVDSAFFAPDPARASPYPANRRAIAFTGAMDYWPNVDAVKWFAQDILPELKRRHPDLLFAIVGSNPAPAVQALHDGRDVVVTGTVPDVRAYIQHAAVSVVPIRIARGIQNKVLEAMSMARPVVVSQSCMQGLDAGSGRHVVPAAEAADFIEACTRLLADRPAAEAMGQKARGHVVEVYSWQRQLALLDDLLNDARMLS
jgi:sugar transferase (PEP-CTERM/EpsH1 system associated)